MNLLFEEDGGFKAGSMMADNDSSLQVEMPSGKRSKIKAATVLLRFEKPAAGALFDQATPLAEEIEPDFLWECVNDGEFSFLDFARDYYGHVPSPVEATAVLLALHAAPVYFHRKGKGRFRKAPADILAAALASLEKKRQQAVTMEGWIEALKEFRLPPEIGALTDALLYAPDRNKAETKAFETACADTGLSAAQLLFKCGAIKSAYHLHYRRFPA
jgi:exoribonuclease-2